MRYNLIAYVADYELEGITSKLSTLLSKLTRLAGEANYDLIFKELKDSRS